MGRRKSQGGGACPGNIPPAACPGLATLPPGTPFEKGGEESGSWRIRRMYSVEESKIIG